MDSARRTLTCSECGMSSPVHYTGTKPPWAPKIVYLEKAFVMKDPFQAGRAVAVGGMCALCSARVCTMKTCSLFYSHRFCASCASEHRARFPRQLQAEISALVPHHHGNGIGNGNGNGNGNGGRGGTAAAQGGAMGDAAGAGAGSRRGLVQDK